MSLKPSKKTDAGKAWNRSRKDNVRKIQLGHHLIVTEGTKTEPYYFEGLKKAIEITNRSDRLYIAGKGLHTLDLMESALSMVRHSGISFEYVWLVYDKDDFPADEFNKVVDLCRENSNDETEYRAIWSNQCIELWYLLHFSFFQADIHRDEYYPKLNAHLKKAGLGEYAKNRKDMFEILRPFLDKAIKNAEKLSEQNAGKEPSASAPGTQMHEMMKQFMPYL